ncbi:LysR family transcriptional regulator [Roseibium sp. HPY-6]|uniref:LysR family transcriptional regulator n=1 Tax=Roseibium sp. HPY-6 TaxID=3229852 RepID=UPI00338FC1A7
MNQLLLITFLDVLETRNFNKTADRLNITQSTVSARIRQLENQLGARLFERGRGGAEPTVAGRRFEEHSRAFLALWGHARRDVREGAGADGRRLRIACQHQLARFFLLDWIEALQTNDPELKLHVEIDFSGQIQRDVLTGQADIGILFTPQIVPDLIISELNTIDYTMVSTKAERLEDVSANDYVRVAYTAFFERTHDELLPDLTHPMLSIGSEDLALHLLRRKGGTLYLPSFLTAPDKSGVADLHPVNGAPTIPQQVYSAVHTRRRHMPVVNSALKSLETFAADKQSKILINN